LSVTKTRLSFESPIWSQRSLIHIKGRRGEKRGGEEETGEQKQV